ASRTNRVSPAETVSPTLTMTLRIFRVWLMVTSYVSSADTVPVPRILALMVPDTTYWAATSGRERFMMVLEKKVRINKITRKMMAKVLTHSRRFVFCIRYHTSLCGFAPWAHQYICRGLMRYSVNLQRALGAVRAAHSRPYGHAVGAAPVESGGC